MSVWVIERGMYSDYSVVGVFSTRENAEMVAAKLNSGDHVYDEAKVAEWPLDPAVADLNQGRTQFFVEMLKDGTATRVERRDFDSYTLADEIREWEREEAPMYHGRGIPNCLHATVWAEDDRHAVKIVNERRIQMLALGQWKGKL